MTEITTAMPPVVFTADGVTYPTAQELKTGAYLDIQSAFGNELNLDPNDISTDVTPQGQIGVTMTAVRLEKDANVAFMANMFNPNTSMGIWQDGFGLFFYGQERLPALPTIVNVECTGLVGITIPAGAQVQDTTANIYQSTQGGIVGASGKVVIPFANIATGVIPCNAGTVTTIYNNKGVIGWDSVTNPADGIVGTDVETQQAFEARRQLSIGYYGHSQVSSIVGNVYKVDGVQMVWGAENDTGSQKTINGVSLVAHSIYISAVGGTDDAVARAIFDKKSCGSAYNGNTTVVVQESDGYHTPYPTTEVKFTRPYNLRVYFAVEAVDDVVLPPNRDSQIRAAIMAQFHGANGAAKATIGGVIHAGKYYCPIQTAVPNIVVNTIAVGDTASPISSSLVVDGDKVPTLNENDIEITWV